MTMPHYDTENHGWVTKPAECPDCKRSRDLQQCYGCHRWYCTECYVDVRDVPMYAHYLHGPGSPWD